MDPQLLLGSVHPSQLPRSKTEELVEKHAFAAYQAICFVLYKYAAVVVMVIAGLLSALFGAIWMQVEALAFPFEGLLFVFEFGLFLWASNWIFRKLRNTVWTEGRYVANFRERCKQLDNEFDRFFWPQAKGKTTQS